MCMCLYIYIYRCIDRVKMVTLVPFQRCRLYIPSNDATTPPLPLPCFSSMTMLSLPLRNTEHPLPTTAAGPQRLTPTRRHPCYTTKKGRARRRTAPTDLAQNWAITN